MTKQPAPIIVTTSWDDGYPSDLRVASLLAERGLRGTFYVPVKNGKERVIGADEVRELVNVGMEVGAHTVNHVELTRLSASQLHHELTEGRAVMEQWTGSAVRSFCYPKGSFSPRLRPALRACGYRLARTTVAFRTDLAFDPLLMPVTLQFLPHSRSVHARHAIKERNALGLVHWLRRLRGATEVPSLFAAALADVRSRGGVLHLWGHSWELDRLKLWDDLQRSFDLLASEPHALHRTNAGVLVEQERLRPVASAGGSADGSRTPGVDVGSAPSDGRGKDL